MLDAFKHIVLTDADGAFGVLFVACTCVLRGLLGCMVATPGVATLYDARFCFPGKGTASPLTEKIPKHGRAICGALRRDRAGFWLEAFAHFQSTIGVSEVISPKIGKLHDDVTKAAERVRAITNGPMDDDMVEIVCGLFGQSASLMSWWKRSLRDGACDDAEKSLGDLANISFDHTLRVGFTWSGAIKVCTAMKAMLVAGVAVDEVLQQKICDELLQWESATTNRALIDLCKEVTSRPTTTNMDKLTQLLPDTFTPDLHHHLTCATPFVWKWMAENDTLPVAGASLLLKIAKSPDEMAWKSYCEAVVLVDVTKDLLDDVVFGDPQRAALVDQHAKAVGGYKEACRSKVRFQDAAVQGLYEKACTHGNDFLLPKCKDFLQPHVKQTVEHLVQQLKVKVGILGNVNGGGLGADVWSSALDSLTPEKILEQTEEQILLVAESTILKMKAGELEKALVAAEEAHLDNCNRVVVG